MLLLISDANILIDVEVGGLIAPMFSLGYRFAVPDVLFFDELEAQHRYLLDLGLETRELDEQQVARVVGWSRATRAPAATTCSRWCWRRRKSVPCSPVTRI